MSGSIVLRHSHSIAQYVHLCVLCMFICYLHMYFNGGILYLFYMYIIFTQRVYALSTDVVFKI